MSKTKSFLRVAIIGVALLALPACSNLDDTQQKMLSGGAAGAVIGTVGVAITGGCIPCGTAIGGVVGAGTGYALNALDKNTKSDSAPPPVSYNSSYNNASSNYGSGPSTPRGDTSSSY